MDFKKLCDDLERFADGQIYMVLPDGKVHVGRPSYISLRNKDGTFILMVGVFDRPDIVVNAKYCYETLDEALEVQAQEHDKLKAQAQSLRGVRADLKRPH